MRSSTSQGRWTLLTGHGHVLVGIARHPGSRVREISQKAGLTERTTAAIIADLEQAGYLSRTRIGRRTRYEVHLDAPFRHKGQEGHRVGPFLWLLATEPIHPATRERGDAQARSSDVPAPTAGPRRVHKQKGSPP